MTTKEPPKIEDVKKELVEIRAQHQQLRRQIVDLGNRTARCSKAILDLQPAQPAQPRLDARVMK